MLGNILLTIGLLAGLFSVVMYFLSYKGYTNALSKARIGFHVAATMTVAASLLLVYAILTHQYEHLYIYKYSGSGLSTGLLLSTFWGGQEGSFLLWAFFTAIIGIILLDYTSKRGDLETRVMMVFGLSFSFLLLLVSPILKSPFNYIWMTDTFIEIKLINQQFLSLPFIQQFMFSDNSTSKSFIKMGTELYSHLVANGISVNEFIIEGKGLNPLLQNFWMQIHPPILFVGFAMSAVPFAFANAALIKNDYSEWVRQSLPWVLAGANVLGLAIMLGGYWAYGILGWGGYWGWDPVENSSLIPWIVGVASIHTLLIQRKTQSKTSAGRFVKTNLILAMLTYVLVLYSTFLTRSGVLGDSSVHSFAEPGMLVYLILVVFMGTFLLIGTFGFVVRWKTLSIEFEQQENIFSKELALFTGAVALLASSIIIIAGTSAPIFGSAVEIRFYNELNLPIAIIIGIINGLSLILRWNVTKGKDIWKNLFVPIGITTALSLVIIFVGEVFNVMLILLTFSAVFTAVVNFEIAYKIARKRPSFLGGYVAHIGIALFMLGVIATGNFSQETMIDLEKGRTQNVLGYDVTFVGYKPIENGKKYAFDLEVQTSDKNSKSVISPVMFVSPFDNSLMREPDIWNMFTRDFYVTPVSYSDGSTEQVSDGKNVTLKKGESTEFKGKKIVFNEFNFPKEAMNSMTDGGSFEIGVLLTVSESGKTYNVEPKITGDAGGKEYVASEIKELDLKINIVKMDASGSVNLSLSTLEGKQVVSNVPKEVLTIEASIKPFINLIWLGVLVVTLGFIISTVRRLKDT
ncbi:MAG: cytochrome c biogenesis protein CcsA [Ignavibacteriae bacterium]|nr:cytochrome c biogenesis protein CcsA [Ignavibacteriota bacterium]